tara:strand:+ start:16779 stop:17027 length:249 start_codon:yes stop_codon:yes gene_type:complete
MTNRDRFLEHNKDVPIVKSAWLNKDKKPARGHPSKWLFSKKTLEDGTVYILSGEDIIWINQNASFNYYGITPDVQGDKNVSK